MNNPVIKVHISSRLQPDVKLNKGFVDFTIILKSSLYKEQMLI